MGKNGDVLHHCRGISRNIWTIAVNQRLGLTNTAKNIAAPDLMPEVADMVQLGFGSLGRPSTISPMIFRCTCEEPA